jgi:VanZ family protein
MVDSKTNNLEWRKGFSAFAPLFVWIPVIFFLSSPAASADETSRIIKPIIEFFFPHTSTESFQTIHFLIRKSAHLTEYAVLGFLGIRAIARSKWLGNYRFLTAVALVAVIASLDEFNQSFEPSRTGAVSDVLLDISGGTIMIYALILMKRPKSEFCDDNIRPISGDI